MSETPRGTGAASPSDPDAGAQRHTTPLRRDNSRITADADGGTGSDAASSVTSGGAGPPAEAAAPPPGTASEAVAAPQPAAEPPAAEPHTDQFSAVPPAPPHDQRPGFAQPAEPPAAASPVAPPAVQPAPPAAQPAQPGPPPAQPVASGGTRIAQQQVPAIRGNPHPGPPPAAGPTAGAAWQAPGAAQQTPGTAQQTPGAAQQTPGTAQQTPGAARQAQPRPGWRSPVWTWVVRGLVLLVVALLSGAAWWALGLGGPAEEQAQDRNPPAAERTKYRFDMLQKEGWLPGCAQVSTSRIAEFFGQHECVHRTRALYTTSLPNGDRVVTTVVTVLMANEQQAAQLNRLLTQDGTGNIKDLVDEGMETHGDLPGLDDKAYGSQQQGELVVIGDSAYMDKDTPKDDPRLLDVTGEALQLGWPQDRDQG